MFSIAWSHTTFNGSASGGYAKLSLPFDVTYYYFLIAWLEVITWTSSYSFGLIGAGMPTLSLGQCYLPCAFYPVEIHFHVSPPSSYSFLSYVCSETPPPHSLFVLLQSMKLCVCIPGCRAVGEPDLPKAPLFWASSAYGWATGGGEKTSQRVYG